VPVRLLLWNLADSKTTLGELRGRVPPIGDRDAWISNEVTERFGLVCFGDLPELTGLRALIGKDPDAYEEFDEE
jgi:hypothetical protein